MMYNILQIAKELLTTWKISFYLVALGRKKTLDFVDFYSEECQYKNRMSQASVVSGFSFVLHSALFFLLRLKSKWLIQYKINKTQN